MLKNFSAKKIPFNFFLLSLKKQTPISLLVTVFLLLICPGMIIGSLLDGFVEYTVSGSPYMLTHEFSSFAIAIFIVSLIAMLISVLSNFGFLYSKKAGDLYHALPLTKNQLLLTKFAASFISALFTLISSFAFLVIINALPFVEGIPLKDCFEYLWIMVSLLLFTTCFTVIFAVISSSFFNFIVSLASISVVLPLLVVLICYWLEQGYGIIVTRFSVIYTSPYLYAVLKLVAKDRAIDDITGFSLVSFIFCIIFSLVFIALAVFLFRIRKTETAEQPFSFKFVNLITVICVSVCGGVFIGTVFSLGDLNDFAFWAFLLFGSLITAVAVGAIQNKNFKTALKSLVLGCLAAFLVFAVFLGSKLYTAYAARFVPNFDDVEKITINGDLVTLSDIDTVLNIHKKSIENGETEYPYSAFTCSYDIKYTLKNGKRLHRSYVLCDNELNLAYLKSDTRLAFYENPKVPNDTSISVYGDDDKDGFSSVLSGEEYKTLLRAYAADIKNATADVFSEECIYISGRMAKDDYGTLRIFSSYENTRNYLEYLKQNATKE